MKPIHPDNVDGRFAIVGENQSEYIGLPARIDSNTIHTRWAFSFRERVAILFGRRLNLEIMTFGKPLQPLLPWIEGIPQKEEHDETH